MQPGDASTNPNTLPDGILDLSTSSGHDPIRLVQQITEQEYKCRVVPTESLAYERFQGITLLVVTV